MIATLEAAFDFTMEMEGGYFDDPAGGPTKYGVSLKAHAGDIGDIDGDGDVDGEDVKRITRAFALEIFKEKYFMPVKADLLAPALGLMMADMAYHHGEVQAVKLLQYACKATGFDPGPVDGLLGTRTRVAATEALRERPNALLAEVQKKRLEFMRMLPNWEPNKNGWTRRCFRCALAAKELCV